MAVTKGEPIVDSACYYVTIRVEGASSPVFRSPWMSLDSARALKKRLDEERRTQSWRHLVEIYYRDGARVSD